MRTDNAIKKPLNKGLPWEGISIPPRYELTDKGVYRQEPPTKEGGEPVDVFISAPIWVRSFEINDRGQWNVNLEFVDRVGHRQTHSVSLSRLYGSATALATELGGLGLRLARSEVSSLSSYLSEFSSPVMEQERKKSEDEQIIESIREFILRNEDRFQSGEAFPVRSRAGYRYKNEDWWAFTSTALLEASGSNSVMKVARILKKAGMLVTNDSNNNMKCPMPNGRRVRMYVVAGHILECDAPTLSAIVTKPPPLPEIETSSLSDLNPAIVKKVAN